MIREKVLQFLGFLISLGSSYEMDNSGESESDGELSDFSSLAIFRISLVLVSMKIYREVSQFPR